VASRLAGVKLAAVYSSPLERARETAAAIARPRRLAVRIARDLVDLDVGRWAGLTLRAARKRPEWAAIQRHPSGFRFPNGESFTDMQARMVAALGRVVARHPGETVVAVSHADPIKAVLAHALGIPLDLFQRLVVATASVSAVAYGPTGPTVLTANATGDGLGVLLAK
jgi:probable phosphoglycerate mutase